MFRLLSLATAVSFISLLVTIGHAQCLQPWEDDIFQMQHQISFPPITPESSSPGPKIVFDERVFFPAFRPNAGTELFWYTVCGDTYDDPAQQANAFAETMGGTQGAVSRRSEDYVIQCEKLYFVADCHDDLGIYRQRCLHTISDNQDGTIVRVPVVDGTDEFFDIANLTQHKGGQELWFTAEGFSSRYGAQSTYLFRLYNPFPDQCVMEMVDIVVPGGNVFNFRELESEASQMAFTVSFDDYPFNLAAQELWRTSGGIANSFRVFTPGPMGPISPFRLTYDPTHQELYFVGSRTIPGPGYLYRVGPTPIVMSATPVLIARTGGSGQLEPQNPNELTPVNGDVVFSGTGMTAGRELWTSGGTGTTVNLTLNDIESGSGHSNPFDLRRLGSQVFFLTNAPTPANEGLFRIGPKKLARRMAAVAHAANLHLLEGGIFYFAGDIPNKGNEVWYSGGTELSTYPVADSNTGPADGSPNFFVRYFDDIIFSATFPQVPMPDVELAVIPVEKQ